MTPTECKTGTLVKLKHSTTIDWKNLDIIDQELGMIATPDRPGFIKVLWFTGNGVNAARYHHIDDLEAV